MYIMWVQARLCVAMYAYTHHMCGSHPGMREEDIDIRGLRGAALCVCVCVCVCARARARACMVLVHKFRVSLHRRQNLWYTGDHSENKHLGFGSLGLHQHVLEDGCCKSKEHNMVSWSTVARKCAFGVRYRCVCTCRQLSIYPNKYL